MRPKEPKEFSRVAQGWCRGTGSEQSKVQFLEDLGSTLDAQVVSITILYKRGS